MQKELLLVGGVYQFGVYQGDSMRQLRTYFPSNQMIGFDSFSGLPDEASSERGLPMHWTPRAFHSVLGEASRPSALSSHASSPLISKAQETRS